MAHYAVLSRVTAVVIGRPTPLVCLANEINHRDAEPNLVRFGSAEAEDSHCEHGHILADMGFIGAKCGARQMKSAQSLHPAPLILPGSGSLRSAVGSEELRSLAQHKPHKSTSCVSCRRDSGRHRIAVYLHREHDSHLLSPVFLEHGLRQDN